jgi:DNA-binding GntR family transcriptional regulator
MWDPDPQAPPDTALWDPDVQATSDTVLRRVLGLRGAGDTVVAITKTLAREIIEGRQSFGADLNSVELSRRFSCSRAPVREALVILEYAGLVNMPARRRPRVVVPDERTVEEVYRMRAMLNAVVSERVAAYATDEQLACLERELEHMVAAAAAGSNIQYFWANVSFHERESDASGDRILKKTIDSLGLQVLSLRRLTLALPERMQYSLDDHRRLLRAYHQRDVELAGALSKSIVQQAYAALTQGNVLKSLIRGVAHD